METKHTQKNRALIKGDNDIYGALLNMHFIVEKELGKKAAKEFRGFRDDVHKKLDDLYKKYKA